MSDNDSWRVDDDRPRWCYIDGCRNQATLVIPSYPDDITLCDEHSFLHHEDDL